ncbi:hypothetical protein ACTG2S_14635 [Aeromonas sp. 82P]|uniref:hypothetical protein n=1 Tax=Aeromonas TaxID=642 RepID=UPI002363A8BF|nr:hypothetical protein [Aeromonas veronii]MDD1843393.1 hypothetical protein [Aeromonas veronii]
MKNPGLPGFLLSVSQSLCKKTRYRQFLSECLINHTIALSARFSLPECHHQVTDLSIFMADKAIFLHGLEKTKNSNAEKRFPIFMFNLVIIKALNLSLMFFCVKLNVIVLIGFFVYFCRYRWLNGIF